MHATCKQHFDSLHPLQAFDSIQEIDFSNSRYSTLIQRCAVQDLFRCPSGIYVLRIAVPVRLRAVFAKREIITAPTLKKRLMLPEFNSSLAHVIRNPLVHRLQLLFGL